VSNFLGEEAKMNKQSQQWLLMLTIVVLSAAALFQQAGTGAASKLNTSPDGLWQEIDEAALVASPDVQTRRPARPQSYRVVQLDQKALTPLLAQAPMEFTEAARTAPVVMTLPMPDGAFARFRIQESPVMSPALARQFPDMKTYSGYGLDDPTATARLDWSPAGFHAMVLSAGDTVYIDPYRAGDARTHISFYRGDFKRGATKRFQCLAKPRPDLSPRSGSAQTAQPTGDTLRIYRLAVAATGEYTQFHSGAQGALRAIMTTINRVNGLYERDFSVRWALIDKELEIIYTDPDTDPYTNDDAGMLADENQANLDQVIGTANYDLGHVFSTAPGGVGAAGLCDPEAKAIGATGTDSPTGDPFDIEFVAHEMIHQLGGNHTFSALIDDGENNCNSDNRNSDTAYEPGSGSTAASYSGTCECADFQQNSDDYFHIISIEEVTNYIANLGANDCARKMSTGNRPPSVNAGQNVTVPAGTPFTLTATGSDPDGQAVTYCWEQFNLGDPSECLTDEDSGSGPLFRSYKPSARGSRTFPSADPPPPGEALPTVSRTMTFRCTARDNRGGVAYDTTEVNVTATGSAFAVKPPAKAWTGGSTRTVTWNVARTNQAPIQCASVRIRLSTDGGRTFPITLVERAPNTGSAKVVVPVTASTSKARIKVEAVGNIFFTVSGADFAISQ
jgi:hypothetical protein